MARYTKASWSDFRLGVITLFAGVLLIGALIFAGGEKGLLFRKTQILKAVLPDVGGLKTGCSVTMAGMSIGKVNRVEFAHENPVTPIQVTMEIRSDIRMRIKTDSVPSVRTQGMLGDRYIDITAGSFENAVLPEGQVLKGKATADFDMTLHQTQKVLGETQKLLSAVNEKQGTAGHFIYDSRLYDKLVNASQELNDLIKDLKEHPKKYLKFSVF